jgi:ring-1,2-phenylacetyl-CoA epoxidase subunit PaaA
VLGVSLPDPLLKWNEARGHHDFGPIDWDEFWRVVGGDGPCNRERLSARVKAWDDGAWVRDAAMAHARKQAQKSAHKSAHNTSRPAAGTPVSASQAQPSKEAA